MNRNFFEKLAGIFIGNRQLGVLTIVAIILFGLIGFVLMPKQYNPEIVAPAFRVTTVYPGASLEDVYQTVTRPLEDKVREIPAVDDIFAQTRAGLSVLTVTFDIGSDKEKAKINLIDKLRSNMRDKPSNVGQPQVESVDPDDVAQVVFALTSDKFSESSLRALAFDFVDYLKLAPGVSKVEVVGGLDKELRILVDENKMQARQVGLEQIIAALQTNNIHLWQSDIDSREQNIPIGIFGNLSNPQQIGAIEVAPGVRLDEVATVSAQLQKRDFYSRFFDGQAERPAVFVGVAKQSGTNATVVADDILQRFEQFAQNLPAHVQIQVVRNDGEVAVKEIAGLTKNLIMSVGIVGLVLLLFLSTRSALIVIAAIPLSLLSVFGMGLLFDQTINRITLFALILSLGLLVDSATVVVENMVRQLKNKKSYEKSEQVITRSVAEVANGLIMSTVTTVLAFVPMAFVGGMMGPYMGPIPFFVPIALIASLLIALTINPFIGWWLLGRPEKKQKSAQNPLTRVIAKVQQIAQKAVQKTQDAYEKFLRKMFAEQRARRVLVTTVSVLLLIALALPTTGLVPFRMLPKADRNQFFIYLDLPANTDLSKTEKVSRELVAEVVKNKEVVSVQSYIALAPVVDFNGLFKGSDARFAESQATFKVNLTDADLRTEQSEEVAQAVREMLTPLINKYGATVVIVEDPPGPPVLSTFQVKVQGYTFADRRKIEQIAQDVMAMAGDVEGVADLSLSTQQQGVRFAYQVDVAKASSVGVATQQVIQTLRAALDGVAVGVWYDDHADNRRFAQERKIMLRLPERESLDNINVTTNTGKLMAVSDLLLPTDQSFNEVLQTDGRLPTVYIGGEMVGRSVVYASIDMLKKLHDYKLPSGQGELVDWNLFGVTYRDADGAEYRIMVAGEWELTLEVFADMGVAFAVAILVIYFVLVAQFSSARIPLYILATIPLGLIGVLFGFALLNAVAGVYFTATAMIGVIALAGIVVNNAIIYLEYVLDLLAEDYELEEALVVAGKTRLLPIVLTSLTTVLGSLTIVSDPVWEGLAWAIILGLSLSAFLTLIMLPLIYRKFEKR